MTVSSEVNRAGPYLGNGSTTVFGFGFRILDASHLRVILTSAAGAETDLAYPSGYSVAGVGSPSGGSITISPAPISGVKITILRNVPMVQETDLENQGAYYAETVERAFDLVVMQNQQQAEELRRAVKVPAGDPDPDGALSSSLALGILRLYESADNIDAVAGNSETIDTVAEAIVQVQTVAAGIADVQTVSGAIADVQIVAGDIADVRTVAGARDDMSVVADNIDGLLNASGSVVSVAPASFTADGVQLEFLMPFASTASNVLVWINKVRQRPGEEYNVDGELLQFYTPPADGGIIDVLIISAVSSQQIQDLYAEFQQGVRIVHRQVVTSAGVRAYSVDTVGQALNLTQTGHVLFGGAPFGPLTLGVDYSVSDGGILLAADPAAGELLSLMSMPRVSSSEAQAILQDFEDAVSGQADRAEAAAETAILASAVTPEAFGAVGNGIADDTVAVQAWAAQTGRIVARGVYRIAAQVDVTAARVDAENARFFYSETAPAETSMFRFMTAGTRWDGGEIDGNLRASEGIFSLVGRHRISGVEMHGFRSVSGRAIGVRLEGGEGSQIKGCHIYDLFALGDSTSGNAPGSCRGIFGTGTFALTYPHIWTDNEVHDVWGEEGDGIQLLYFNGTPPMLSAARSVVASNRVYGCGRRAMKCQASGVIIRNNDFRLGGGTPPSGQDLLTIICVLNILDGRNCTVRGNTLIADVAANALLVTMSEEASAALWNTFTDNLIIGHTDFDTVFLNRQSEFDFSGNEIRGGRQGVSVGFSSRGSICDNRFIVSVASGTFPDINLNSTDSEIVVARNRAVGGAKDRMITAGGVRSIYRDNDHLRSAGTGIFVSGTVEAVVDGTVSMGSGSAVLSSVNSARVSDTVNLGTGDTGFAAGTFWSNGDPTTTRANRKHALGDVCYSTIAGATVGWRCTASGTPGTWTPFS